MDLFPKNYKKNNLLSPDGVTKQGTLDFLKNLKNKLSFSGGSQAFLSKTKETLLRLGVVLSGAVLILVLLLWGGLYFYSKSLTSQIADLKKQQSEVFNAEDKALASKIVSFDKGAALIQSLLKNHTYSSVVFDKLAAVTLPRVQWRSLDFSLKNSEISMKGFSANYAALAQQLLAFEGNEFSNIKASSIALDKTGGVSFVLTFNFSPKILQK